MATTPRRKSVAPTQTAGTSGTPIWGGYVAVTEKSSALQGIQRYTTFAETVKNTSIVAAGVRKYIDLVAKPAWHANAADGDRSEELVELVEDLLDDMQTPLRRIVRGQSLYPFYGFYWGEWIAKRRDDGKLGIKDVERRPQHTIERWDVDPAGKIVGVEQRSPQTGQIHYLPRQKSVYLVDDGLTDSPEGLGLLRHIVPHAKRLSRYEQLEGIAYETDLRGIPLARVPLAKLEEMVAEGKITEAQKQAAISDLANLVENHIKSAKTGLYIESQPYYSTGDDPSPSQVPLWDFQLLQGGATGQEAVAAAIGRINHEIARILGMEQLLLGETRGTQALSEDKSQMLLLAVETTLADIRDAWQADVLWPIWQLNGLDPALMPKLKTDPIHIRDVEQITRALADMAKAGSPVSLEDPITDWVRDQLGAPHVPELMLEQAAEDAALLGSTEDDAEDADDVDDLDDGEGKE